MGILDMESGTSLTTPEGTPPGFLGIVPKGLFRSRAKSQTRINTDLCIWTPEGNCCWKSISGHRVLLTSIHLLLLSDKEITSLQQYALSKLRAMNLGCKIDIPKEESGGFIKLKRRPMLLRKKAKSTSFFEGKDKKETTPDPLVFGIPLAQCLQNDKGRPNENNTRTSDDLVLDIRRESLDNLMFFPKEETTETSSEQPRVPNVVNSCFRHIEQYGLHTIGIFRVSSSMRKVRQLREDIDNGLDIVLNENYHPHEVGQLLKEYFRDLPEPLLTRELYTPFLSILRIRNRKDQIDALRYLVSLLPPHNRDTLWALLHFLKKVASHSQDTRTLAGTTLTGNKMDSGNLATLFGPNIFHNTDFSKDGGRFAVDSPLRAQERSDVILVVGLLLEHYQKIFQIPAEDLDSVYRRLQVSEAEFLNNLLRQRFYSTLDKKGEFNLNQDRGRARDRQKLPADRQQLSIPMIAISADSTDDEFREISATLENEISQLDLLTINKDLSPRRKSFPEKLLKPDLEPKEPNPKSPLEKRRSSFTEMLAKALLKTETDSSKAESRHASPHPSQPIPIKRNQHYQEQQSHSARSTPPPFSGYAINYQQYVQEPRPEISRQRVAYKSQRHLTTDWDMGHNDGRLSANDKDDFGKRAADKRLLDRYIIEKSASANFFPAKKNAQEQRPKQKKTYKSEYLSLSSSSNSPPRRSYHPHQSERLRRGDLIASEHTIKSKLF